MHCPTCNAQTHTDIHLVTDAFREELDRCPVCGTVWSVSHGTVEIVADPAAESFLSSATECVECDDYNLNLAH